MITAEVYISTHPAEATHTKITTVVPAFPWTWLCSLKWGSTLLFHSVDGVYHPQSQSDTRGSLYLVRQSFAEQYGFLHGFPWQSKSVLGSIFWNQL